MPTCKIKSAWFKSRERQIQNLRLHKLMLRWRLYEALADVARSNPEQASAVVVAMAIQGVGQESEAGDTRIVPTATSAE